MSETKPTTAEERAQFRAEEGAATEGPWTIEVSGGGKWDGRRDLRIGMGPRLSPELPCTDAKLIVTMRNNWLRILDENERLREENQKLTHFDCRYCFGKIPQPKTALDASKAWHQAAIQLFQMAVDVDEKAAEHIYATARRKAE